MRELELNVVSEDVKIEQKFIGSIPIILSSKDYNSVSHVSAAALLPITSSSLECST